MKILQDTLNLQLIENRNVSSVLIGEDGKQSIWMQRIYSQWPQDYIHMEDQTLPKLRKSFKF